MIGVNKSSNTGHSTPAANGNIPNDRGAKRASERNAGQIALDQRHAGALHGYIGACPHGYAHFGFGGDVHQHQELSLRSQKKAMRLHHAGYIGIDLNADMTTIVLRDTRNRAEVVTLPDE
jgi:hypothetical protein